MNIDQTVATYKLIKTNRHVIIRVVFNELLDISHDILVKLPSNINMSNDDYTTYIKSKIRNKNDINLLCSNINISTNVVDIRTFIDSTIYTFKNLNGFSFEYVDNFIDIDKISYIITACNRNSTNIELSVKNTSNFSTDVITQLQNINTIVDSIKEHICKILSVDYEDSTLTLIDDYSLKTNKIVFCFEYENKQCYINIDYRNSIVNISLNYKDLFFDILNTNINQIKNKVYTLYNMIYNCDTLLTRNVNIEFQEKFRNIIFYHLNTKAEKTIYEFNKIADLKRILTIHKISKEDSKYKMDLDVYDSNGNLKYKEFYVEVSRQKIYFEFSKFLSQIV